MPKPASPPARKHTRPPLWKLGALCAVAGALFYAALAPEGQTDEEYLLSLIERKEAGEFLASGEEKDYCILMASLRDSIVLDCMPVLEGINWERPPKSPEALGPDWVEITHPEARKNGNRREFYHRKYPKLKIAFDKGAPEQNHKGLKAYLRYDHWHRQNPNASNKLDFYLDKNGRPVPDKSKESHILVKTP